jgi:hypothetical protein
MKSSRPEWFTPVSWVLGAFTLTSVAIALASTRWCTEALRNAHGYVVPSLPGDCALYNDLQTVFTISAAIFAVALLGVLIVARRRSPEPTRSLPC